MALLQWQYFKALAEKENLTQTAKSLMISAPSLSATIARLEQDVGYQLFDRKGRNIYLNECGRIYLKHVNDILSSLENAKQEMRETKPDQHTRLSIAISSPIIWHDPFQTFIKSHPHITLIHTLIKTNRLEDPTYCAQFDFIMTATSDLPGDNWNCEIIYADDKPVLAVYPSHPLAARRAIRFIEAKEENFICLTKGFSMRKYFDALCAIAGFKPKIVMECDYLLRSKMLAAKYGIILTTQSGAQTGLLGDTAFIDILDPGVRRTQAIHWNKKHYLSETAIRFRDFIVDYHRDTAH